ncbi:MAG: pyridine nucleotide-disulfide oxidoreductase family protein [Betaproteobacteria bacterium]|jgi:tricarballylate dehydrogenase|nr:pyridine nucleotide-disulfide oxidoreductase family protein [Betaproteobacteria bacterium]
MYDVIVVGGGNAACAAAVSARENGAKRVVLLEKAPKEQRGGNTHFSGAIFRFVFNKVEELDRFVPQVEEEYPGFHAGVPKYPREAFREDLMRVTEGRSDPELADLLIDASYDTTCWMQDVGKHKFELARSVMGIKVGNQYKWPRGAIVRTVHEGVGLSSTWFKTVEAMGIEIRYEAHVLELTQSESGRIDGVVVRGTDGVRKLNAKAVVLACGGFETNPEWRTRYLGQEWAHAKVRGSNFNYGDGLRMALDMGAMPWGHWGGCHATPIVSDAPDYGVRNLTDKTNRLSYHYGVMLNVEGKRWIDEGADMNAFTYAKYGGLILKQTKGRVYQIFDSKVLDLLEPRYKTSEPFKSDTLEGLLKQLDIDQKQAMKTLQEYNNAAERGGPFNPAVLDHLSTEGIEPAKTNWAQKLDKPPFYSWAVTGGITFTFGGLKINKEAQVISTGWKPIEGLYAAGEMVGGLFHYNYALGTGLMSGSVFGRIAGRSAARS